MARSAGCRQGQHFDRFYNKSMINDHERTVALFKGAIAERQDPDASASATTMLPAVQGNLKKIQSIARAAGIQQEQPL
jgi:predicted outer membrane protein